jgi:hypothetical protein
MSRVCIEVIRNLDSFAARFAAHQSTQPIRVRRGRRHHRPIAAEEASIRSELGQCVVEERLGGLHTRRPADDLGHQPGQLADDVAPGRKLRDLQPPGTRILTDPGLAGVVQYELDIGSAAHELDHLIQL